jgi:hypothetical protein
VPTPPAHTRRLDDPGGHLAETIALFSGGRAHADTPWMRSPLFTALASLASILVGASPALAAPAQIATAGTLPNPTACVGCWQPAVETSWQWQLQGRIDGAFDVDMFDIDGFEASASLVDSLHASGSAVVCYIDVGSWERWRPDANAFPQRVLGRSDGWPGERWLDVRRVRVLLPIMRERLDMCAAKGFDGVEMDLVDGFRNRTGFPITGSDQLRYNVLLANEVHDRGMSVALKNDLGQIDALLPYFDYALNEQCHQYHECARLRPFVNAGKAVFGVEYRLRPTSFCPQANAEDFNFLRKDLRLRALPRIPCRGA